ncbi:MAG: hypothetical protein Q9213_000491 [Squamulea squamosa]
MAPVVDPARPHVKNINDIGSIWRTAIDRYEAVTGIKLDSLATVNSVEEILDAIHEKDTNFKSFRHDGSKVDRFRSLVSKSLRPIEILSNITAEAASSVRRRFLCDKLIERIAHPSSANAVSADYEKISGFFEDLDMYLHRLKVLEERVPLLPELEMAITKIFTSVLVLCAISAKYVKMKRIVKAFRNLGFGEDDELTTAYAHFHKMVEQEGAAVRNATLAGVEQIKNKTLDIHSDVRRGLATMDINNENAKTVIRSNERIDEYLKHQEATVEREDILKAISTLSFHDKQRDVYEKHHHGTGQWLLSNDKFQEWFTGNQNTALWCPGIPGAGKTVMTSIVVNHIEEETRGTDSALAYVYCDYKDTKTQSAIGLLSSVTRQLAEQSIPLRPEAKTFRDNDLERRRNPTEDERISLLRSMCSLFQTVYVCVDALDVCPELDRQKLLSMLQNVAPFIRIYITSLPHIDPQAGFINMSRLDILAESSDIKAYLESEVSKSKRLSMFTARDTTLKDEIINTVNEKAAGMFLLAYLQIGRLSRQISSKAVRKTINALPEGVYATYEDVMKRIEEQPEEEGETAKRALSYIFCATRPLKLGELLHALAVEAEDTELDETAFIETEILLNVSGGLIIIDEKSGIVRLVHHTLQQYLQDNRTKLLHEPEGEIARVCLTYLSFNAFASGPCIDGDAMDQRLRAYDFLNYASHNWGRHVSKDPVWIDFVLSYLNDQQKLACSVQVLHLAAYRTPDWQDCFPKQFGPLHVLAYFGLHFLFSHFVETAMDVNGRDSDGASALHIAAKNGHTAAVKQLLAKNANTNIEDNSGETALHCASRNGDKAIVELLLLHGANVMKKDTRGWGALDWAVIEGKDDVVKILLEHGVDAEANGRNEALFLAAGEGHATTVEMLLDNGAEVDAKDWLGSTAMDFAAPGGYEATVRVLLQHGARLDLRDTQDNSVLHWAVPHEAVTKLLLDSGADPNAKNERGQTPLCWVARDGPTTVAQLLLENHGEIDLADKFGCTALHGAALRDREDMLRLLLDHGADPRMKDQNGWTALHVAALRHNKDLIRLLSEKVDDADTILDWVGLQQQDTKRRALLQKIIEDKAEGSTVMTGLRLAVQEKQFTRLKILIEKGADVNEKEAVGGWTALIIASDQGYEAGATLLLQHGADVDLSGREGWSPLHWACKNGHGAVVRILLDHGAKLDANGCGWTPMLLAAKHGHMTIVQTLADMGADINFEDYYRRRTLHWAAKYGHEAICRLLIDVGADLDATDHWGRTALIWAVENKQHAITKLLLAKGANVNATTLDGSTALHLAVFLQDEDTVQKLLDNWASIEAKTRTGFTALHVAATVGYKPVVQLLLEREADTKAEARWRYDDVIEYNDMETGYEYDEKATNLTGLKSLNQSVHRLLFSSELNFKSEEEGQHTFTPRQLAARQGHLAVQQLVQ